MSKNEVAFIHKLFGMGYTQKQIVVIMGSAKSTISRICSRKTYQGIYASDYETDAVLEDRLNIFNIIVSCKEIPGMGALSEEDKRYVKLLKFCHVEYAEVRHLYRDVPSKFFNPIWKYENYEVLFRHFDSTLIGIDEVDFKKIIK